MSRSITQVDLEEVKVEHNGSVTFKRQTQKKKSVKDKKPKAKKPKRVQCIIVFVKTVVPPYPATEYKDIPLNKDLSKEMAVTQLLDGILEQQCAELDQTYTNHFSYIGKI